MSGGFDRRLAALLAVFTIPIVLGLLWVTTRESVPPEPRARADLRTSIRGPLQQRLASAFPGSFETGIQLFWEEGDGWVSPEVLEWWVRVVEDDGLQELTWENAEGMLSRFRPTPSPAFATFAKRRRCAVVGPSRNLVSSNYGAQIDAHDVVIRINRAPTAGFESDVGVTTTHHLMWPKRELREPEFDRSAFLLMTPITAGIEDLFSWMRYVVEDELRWGTERVNVVHPEFVKYLDDKWTRGEGAYPSTGFIALMLAVHVCDEVDVFGFGADASGRWDHYYEEDLGEAVWFHPATVESRVRQELEQRSILKVFRGSRPEVEPPLEEGAAMGDAEGTQPR